jgi:osmoprotectant transport system permease protein
LHQLLEHLELVFTAIGMAVVVGVSLGVVLTRVRRLAGPTLGAASVVQTIPSLALVALMVPFMGIGKAPAIAALFLYALLPMLRNTYTAIDEVDPAIIEVGRGMGMTNWQILLKVEIPLCVPVVMAGVRTSTVIGVGIATLSTFIGAGGLGDTIMIGLQQSGARANALILAGVVAASALALSLDGLAALVQKLLTPRGLKLQTVQ